MRSDCMRYFLPSLTGLMLSAILVGGVSSRTNNSVTSSADGSSSGVVGNNNNYNNWHRRFSVNNYDDAVKYLRKYGYLRCIVANPRVRRQASSFMSEVILREDTPTYGSGTGQTSPSSTGNAGSPRRRCNRADVSHALKVMQTHFRLPVTGHVDVTTKQTMNKGRCGNADVPPKSQMANHINDHNDPEGTSSSRHRKNTSAQSHHAAHHHNHHQHSHHHANSGAGESGDRPFRRFIRHAFVGTSGSGDGVSNGHRIRHGHHQRHGYNNRLLNREGHEDVLSDTSSSGSERQFNDVIDPEGSGGHLHLPLQHDDREDAVNEQSTNVGDDAAQSGDLSKQPLMPTASLPLGLTVMELPTTKTIVESKLRRQSMLAEIKTRLNSSPLSTTSNADGRVPKDKMALAAELKQTGRRRRRETLRRRNRRSVRAVSIDQVVIEGSVPAGSLGSGSTATRLQTDRTVRWRLLDDGIGSKIPLIHQKSALELSFRMWSEVTPVKFVEDRSSHVNDVDILIAFGKQQHLNCDKSFDGSGGELAHSWAAGDIHFDDDENYRLDISDEKPMPPTTTTNAPVTSTPQADVAQSISLQKLALHEIGHVLGLIHNYDRHQSIMYPIYVTPNTHEDFELQRDDRRAVQQIYGVCKGSFDLTFDWLRKSSYNSDLPGTAGTGNGQDPTTPTPSGAGSSTHPQRPATFFYNTYFFRGERFWMYENRDNRTRYGDPVYIDRDWHGLPGHLDGFTQVISKSGQSDYNIDTYFFKGDLYYKYDDSSHRVAVGYPRRIADDFGSNGQQQQLGIPNNIDAVWFDMNDGMLYFFKGEWVWTFDPRDIGRNACCAQPKRRFSEVFPMLDRDDPDPLTGHVTTVFYSFHRRTVFMFRGEEVYELVSSAAAAMAAPSSSSNPTSASSSVWAGIRRLRPWYEIWYDICDVE